MCGHMCLWFWPRARFFCLSKGESQGIHFVVSEEPGWRWRGSTTIDWRLFLKIPSLPSKQGSATTQRSQSHELCWSASKREINFNLLLRNYWLDSQCGGKEKACNTLMAVTVMSQQWKGFFTRRSLTQFLCTAFVCTTCCPPYHFSRSISSLHCNPKLVGPT